MDPRIRAQINQVESRISGLDSGITDHQRRLARARRDHADAGRHHDALLRQRKANDEIKNLERGIASLQRERQRAVNERRNLSRA